MRQGWVPVLWMACCTTVAAGHALAQLPDFNAQWPQACVEAVRPVAKSSLSTKAVGSAEDIGNLTIIEYEGNYARGLAAPRQEIATRFYANHPDAYDFLVVFSTFEFETGSAIAFHNRIRNDTSGIGLPLYDHSEAFGSAGRLQGYIDMAAMGRYSFSPLSPRYQDLLTTFLHEVMHRWGMSLRFLDANGADSGDLIGREDSHWSYFLDSDASVMLGNDWQVQPDGTFRSVDARHRYSPIDLYAAGLAAAGEVQPLMLIRNGTGGHATDVPHVGAISSGTPEAVTIEQIIAATGPRVPPAGISQSDFTAAFILLKRPGEAVPPERLVELERLRIRAAQQFAAATDGRATLRIFTDTAGQGVRLPTILHGSGPAAVPPGLSAAVAWLESRQLGDGHWEDRPATAMRDTVAVVRALTEVDPGFAGLPQARAWIAENEARTLDQQSWKLLATGLAEDAARVESAQAADGGFGVQLGWSSSAYDTALVGAALADRRPDSTALASALAHVGVGQNADGSLGMTAHGRGRVLPTLRAASMFALDAGATSALRLDQAVGWIESRQGADGGIGSIPGTTSLSESIESYALTGRLPLSELAATGLRGHVRQSQQIDGDWGGSVYLTATAALAHARDQRPNLAIDGLPSASPDPVHDGQRLTLRATVTNGGNVPAGGSVLRWYDGNPDEAGAPIGGDVMVAELAAGSRTTVSQEWDTTGRVGEHALWVVVDAAGALEESSEQDNRASVVATVLPPSELAELELLQADFTADPQSISALPSNVRVSGLVRNPGSLGATGVVIRVHEQDSPGVALAETVVDVPARGTTAIEADILATAPRTLRLVIKADADDAIAEASEANNEAALVVPFGQSLDLEVRNSDLGLLTQPALVGRPVEFDIVLRNRGTVDSPAATLRADVVRDAATISILDVALQVPAGQSISRRATWLPGQPGPAQLRISIDPSGQVAEADEGNNDAQLDFEVVALDQPDLTFMSESLAFTPTPGLEGQPLTAQLGVRNLSTVSAHDVLVALYAGDPAINGVMIGSTTLALVAGSADAVATIGVPELALRGDQRMFVRIDADDRLDEVDESNNVVIQQLRVLAMPDLALSVADVVLDPPLPVPGEAVEARVTVRNIGAQDANGFSVRLFEGDADSGTPVGQDEVAGLLPAGASTVLTWHWTLGISPGSRHVTAFVDPDDGVREGSEDNNVASLPFDVQDGTFFANERYISPNGDGIQDAVAVVFRVDGMDAVAVEIANAKGKVVRRYSDIDLNADARGQVIWDGRDDFGRVVTDGTYLFSVLAPGDSGLDGSIAVTVDNNQSSFLEAVGTPYAATTLLPGELRAQRIPPLGSPLHHHLFGFWDTGNQDEGLYRSDAYFTERVPVLSARWLGLFQHEQGDQSLRFNAFEFDPEGGRIAVALRSGNTSQGRIVETAVDQFDAATVVYSGYLDSKVLGYFEPRILVVGAQLGEFRVIDIASGASTELRGFGTGVRYDSARVVPAGVLAFEGGVVRAFAPRDPERPVIHFVPANAGDSGGYRAMLSPNAETVAVHEFDLETERLTLHDLVRGDQHVLIQRLPGVIHGEQSGQSVVVPTLGTGWLERRGQLLVQDARARSLEVYSSAGQRLSTTSFPPLFRTGEYAVDDGDPPRPSMPDMVLPTTYPALTSEDCTTSLPAAGIERRILDPANSRLFIGFGEDVAWEHFPEGWQLTHGAGIREFFSVDVDTGTVELVHASSRMPLVAPADQAAYPLLASCDESPPADWPQLFLRDGARIGTDGRIYPMSGSPSVEPWVPENPFGAIWPDDSKVLQGNLATASLLDLGILLRARTLGRGIELHGVAADRNFAHFQIDWASIEHPNDWHAVVPASPDEVFLDEFLTWVPPQPGTFVMRLTVTDLAGNQATSYATAASFESAAIDNFSIAPRYVSPNGDGVQDESVLGYRVRQPSTLAIRIHDANGALVRSVDRTYDSSQLGPDEYVWDGRRNDGAFAADGRYRVSVGGFGAWVVVDVMLPAVDGELRQAYLGRPVCHDGQCRTFVHVAPVATWSANDANLRDASLESRPLGGDQWTPTAMGLVATPIQFAGKAFRVRAVDRAGNDRTHVLGSAEEALILGGIQVRDSKLTFDYQPPPFVDAPDTTSWKPIQIDRGSQEDSLVVSDYVRTFVGIGVETSVAELPGNWVERSLHEIDELECDESGCSNSHAGQWAVPFDDSGMVPGSVHFVRIRGDRADGTRIHSNIGYIRVGGIDAPTCKPNFPGEPLELVATEHFAGRMSNAVLHMGAGDAELQVPAFETSDDGFRFRRANDSYIGPAWVDAFDEAGMRRRSETTALECFPVDEPPDDLGQGWRLTFDARPVIQDTCDGLPSHRVLIKTSIHPASGEGVPVGNPQSARISYTNAATGAEVVVYDGAANSSQWPEGIADHEISTAGWPQGEHEVRLTLAYDGTSPIDHTIRFPVVHDAPAIEIIAPEAGDRVCARPFTADPDLLQIPISVDVVSASPSGYRILLGSGSHPTTFDCMVRKGEDLAAGPAPDEFLRCGPYAEVAGFSGHFPLGDAGEIAGAFTRYHGASTVQLKAANWSGGTICRQHQVLMDAGVDFRERSAPLTRLQPQIIWFGPLGIAPTAGVPFEEARVFLRAEEPVHVTATVHRASVDAGEQVPSYDPDVLATLNGPVAVEGDLDIRWNGSIEGGTVADGLYALKVEANDDCAFLGGKTYWVYVDDTPPAASIATPVPGATILTSVVEVVGSVTDELGVKSWSLDVALASSPDAWQNLARGNRDVPQPTLLGTWLRGAVAEPVVLRLTAVDHVGNRSESRVPLDLGEPASLIGTAALQPALFSPNADGALDSTRVQLGLLRTASIDVRVTDPANAVVAQLYAGTQSAGTAAWGWTGRAAGGQSVPDGPYQVRIDANDPEGDLAPEAVVLSATVDNTPPTLEILRPTGGFASNTSLVELRLADLHFAEFEATLVRTSDGTVVFSTNGTQAGNVVVTSLANFAEGAYTLHAEARDAASNWAIRDATFQIDSTRPTVTLDSPPDGALIAAASATAVAGSIHDSNLAEWTLEVAGESQSDWTELAHGDDNLAGGDLLSWTPGLPDGSYRLRLRAVDRAGNEAHVEHVIEVDGTPPTALITAPLDGGFLGVGAAVEGTASDAHFDNYRLGVIMASEAAGGQWSDVYMGQQPVEAGQLAGLTLDLDEDDYLLRLVVEDRVGLSSSAQIQVRIDARPPAAPISLVGHVEDNRNSVLDWQAVEAADLAGYFVHRDDVRLNDIPIPSPHYVDIDAPEGRPRYYVSAIDHAGNESDASNIVTLHVDRTPPVATIVRPTTGERVRGNQDITGTAHSTDDFKEYRLTMQPVDPAGEPILLSAATLAVQGQVLGTWDTLASPDDSLVRVRLEAEDVNGNVATAEALVTVDNGPPAAPTGLTASLAGADAQVIWDPNAEADLLGYLLYRDDGLVNATGPTLPGDLRPFAITNNEHLDQVVPDGQHQYIVYAIDHAGNVSPPSDPASLDPLDNAPPSMTIESPQSGVRFETQVTVLATSRDTDIAEVRFAYRGEGGTDWFDIGPALIEAPFRVSWDPADDVPYGNYEIRAVARDAGGRLDPTPPSVTVVYADLTPPPAPPGVTALGDGETARIAWSASDAIDLAGYRVYRDGAPVGDVPPTVLALEDEALPDGAYDYTVKAFDAYGNESVPSNFATAHLFSVSLQQPYTPVSDPATELTGTSARPGQVWLQVENETGSADSGIGATGPEGAFTFAGTELAAGANALRVRIVDAQGNWSRTAAVRVDRGDVPSAPTGLELTVDDHQALLRWDENPEPDVIGYRVFRNGSVIESDRLLGEIPIASSSQGSDPGAAVDDDPATAWSTYVVDGDAQDFGPLPELELAWVEPRIVTAIGLSWISADAAAFGVDVFAWSGQAWVGIATTEGNGGAEQSIVLAHPYRTSRMKLALRGDVAGNGDVRELRLAEVELAERPLQGARNLAEVLPDGSHAYQVSAVSAFAFESPLSEAMVADIGDVEGPDAIALSGELDGRDASLSWTASAAPDVARYELQRDGATIASIPAADPREHTDEALPIGSHTYVAFAVDGGGNRSLPSNPVTLVVEGAGPAIPIDLAVTAPAIGATLDVSWSPAPGSTPDHYVLRRSLSQVGPFEVIAAPAGTSHRDMPLANGTTYYYTIEAIDAYGDPSGQSAPASGVPRDRVAPPPPVLTYPTTPVDRLRQLITTTDICGKSEPGALVELDRGGHSLAIASANQVHSVSTEYLFESTDASLPAPDGHHVLITDYASTRLLDLADASIDHLGPRSRLQLWAAHGLALYFVANDSDEMFRWEPARGVQPVAHPLTAISAFAVDTREEQLAIIGTHPEDPAAERLWIVVLAGGDPRPIDGIGSGEIDWSSRLAWSPDGRHLLLAGQDAGWLIDVAAAEVIAQWPISGDAMPAWSGDSRHILYALADPDGNAGVHVLDVATQTGVMLREGSGPTYALAWSPTGDEVGVLNERGIEMIAWPSGWMEPSLPAYVPEGWARLVWTASGALIAHDEHSLMRIESPGWFCARSAPLTAGTNRWSARATDADGNHSLSSAPIEVEVPQDQLPDLALASTDLLIVPASGFAGQAYSVSVTLRNAGTAAVERPELAVDLYRPDGIRIAIASAAWSPLAPGEARTTSYALGTLDMAGTYRLVAEADPLQRVFERNEGNNRAEASFVIAADGLPVLDVSLAQAIFAPGAVVTGEVGVTNPGSAFSGHVVLRIIDPDGVQVEHLGDHEIAQLGFGQRWTTGVAWDAQGVLAGNYRLQASLRGATGAQIAEREDAFTIEAVRHIQLAVGTTPPVQTLGQDVLIRSELDFSDGNAFLEGAILSLLVIDANGIERWRRDQPLGTLLPGHVLARDDTWVTSDLDEGLYTVRLDLHSAEYTASVNAIVTLQAASPGLSLVGSIGIEPGAPLIAGNDQVLGWRVASQSADLENVQARLRVIAVPTQEVVGVDDQSFDLEAGVSHESSFALAAPPLALVPHVAVLEARVPSDAQGEWRLLAQQGFAVVDRMAPYIAVAQPMEGTMQAAVVPFRATILDLHSAIVSAEISLDGGTWQPVSAGADGQYARGIASLVDGGHVLRARARDAWGNEALTDDIAFTVDATPPLITITGVSHGDLLNHDVTPLVTISDDHLATSEMLLDGAAYVQGTTIGGEGSHVLAVRATDLAGNQNLRSIRFTIDLTAPVVAIIEPIDGSTIGEGSVRVVVQSESNVDLALGTGAYQAVAASDGLGFATFDAVPLVLGGNHIEVVATDRAGNASVPASVDVIHEVVATSPLEGSLQPGVAELAHGTPLPVHVLVRNPNAAPMPGQVLRVRVFDESATNLATEEFVRDFAPQEAFEIDFEFASGTWPLGALTLVLEFIEDGDWLVLDSHQLDVVDRIPPMLELVSPAPGTISTSPIVISATASDALGEVIEVHARLDDGDWLALAADQGGAWASPPIAPAEGIHALELQARDDAGNLAAIGPEPFTIDDTAPLIKISGIADGELLAHPVAPDVDVIDLHLATSEVLLNGVPFLPGTPIDVSGAYLLEVSATDAAGNASEAAVQFTLDLDAPSVVFLEPEQGAVTTGESVDVVGQTEARARVQLAAAGFMVELKADASGRFEVPAVPLLPGQNTIVAQASDPAGNTGPEASLVVYREIVAEADVVGEIVLPPSPLPTGTLLDVAYTVSNVGGIALVGMPLRFTLHSEGGDVVAMDELELDLAPGAHAGGTRQLDTSRLAAGTYALSMSASLPGVDGPHWIVLDSGRIDFAGAACLRGDVIFTDGFDATGVRRDGVIFCDGFESKGGLDAGTRLVAASWVAPTPWTAYASSAALHVRSLAQARVARTPARPRSPGSPLRSLTGILFTPSPPPRVPREVAALALAATGPRLQDAIGDGSNGSNGWSRNLQ